MRESAVFLHISSLPGKYGIGGLGKEAYRFVDFLKKSGFSRWELLPLNPCGPANSPYQTNSAFGLNPLLIDLDLLLDEGLLKKSDFSGVKFGKYARTVDFGLVYKSHKELLHKAFKRFDKNSREFKNFSEDIIYKEYAMYMTIKGLNDNKGWYDWKLEYRTYNSMIESFILKNYKKEYDYQLFTQFIFLKQWRILKKYANSNGIKIVGDIPYYLSLDSVEFYFHPELFLVGKNNTIEYISGYPKDAFNKEGQRWGNPLYDWSYMKINNYKWWDNRIRKALDLYDFVRLNHFSGFYNFYAMPFSFMSKEKGFFMPGPRLDFFKDKQNYPLIAAGVGLKDEKVSRFMKDCGYPDIRILELGFLNDDADLCSAHNPSNYSDNCVAYISNHDSIPLRPFIEEKLQSNKDKTIENIMEYCKKYNIHFDIKEICENYLCKKVIEILFYSKAECAVLTTQDLFLQEKNSRMNTPGTVNLSNWTYRTTERDFNDVNLMNYFKELNSKTRRL